MILIDANLLIYAYDTASPFHRQAKNWLEDTLNSDSPIGLSWSGIQAFLRFMTNAQFKGRPSSDAAMLAMTELMEQDRVIVLTPGVHHWEILCGIIRDAKAFGLLITDAHIAALAIEHGATLCTHDRDFARFPKLKIEYPLS